MENTGIPSAITYPFCSKSFSAVTIGINNNNNNDNNNNNNNNDDDDDDDDDFINVSSNNLAEGIPTV